MRCWVLQVCEFHPGPRLPFRETPAHPPTHINPLAKQPQFFLWGKKEKFNTNLRPHIALSTLLIRLREIPTLPRSLAAIILTFFFFAFLFSITPRTGL